MWFQGFKGRQTEALQESLACKQVLIIGTAGGMFLCCEQFWDEVGRGLLGGLALLLSAVPPFKTSCWLAGMLKVSYFLMVEETLVP